MVYNSLNVDAQYKSQLDDFCTSVNLFFTLRQKSKG